MIDGIRPPGQPMRPAMPVNPQPTPPSASEPPEEDDHDTLAAKVAFVFIGIIFVLIVAGLVFWLYYKDKDSLDAAQETARTSETEEVAAEGLELDPNKNYGDKYADGILPVGDKKYVTNGPKKGHIYLCDAKFAPENKAGAAVRGPWFIGTDEWNTKKKYKVQGNVNFASRFTDKVANGIRTISTNGLPSHPAGNFPVTMTDPASMYDRNPNSIKAQDFTINLSAEPEYSATPSCMGGEVGVLLTGAILLNGFDAGGRDAGAWEIQDGCDGHPQTSGIYHYHTMTNCIKNVTVSTVIGYALDGFPITGSKVSDKNYLTTNDLDECHGIVSEIMLDGKKVKMYHYVMTQDFPYSVSCLRGSNKKSGGGLQPTGQQQPGGGNLQVQGQQPPALGP